MGNVIAAYFLRVDEETGVPFQGYLGEMENTLEARQNYVNFDRPGGYLQVVHLSACLDIVCHEEGKMRGFPANRGLFYGSTPLDLFVGNILVLRRSWQGFSSIFPADIPYIEAHLRPVKLIGKDFLLPLPVMLLPEYEEGKK